MKGRILRRKTNDGQGSPRIETDMCMEQPACVRKGPPSLKREGEAEEMRRRSAKWRLAGNTYALKEKEKGVWRRIVGAGKRLARVIKKHDDLPFPSPLHISFPIPATAHAPHNNKNATEIEGDIDGGMGIGAAGTLAPSGASPAGQGSGRSHPHQHYHDRHQQQHQSYVQSRRIVHFQSMQSVLKENTEAQPQDHHAEYRQRPSSNERSKNNNHIHDHDAHYQPAKQRRYLPDEHDYDHNAPPAESVNIQQQPLKDNNNSGSSNEGSGEAEESEDEVAATQNWSDLYMSLHSAYKDCLAALHHKLCQDLHQSLLEHRHAMRMLQAQVNRAAADLQPLLADVVYNLITPGMAWDMERQRRCCRGVGSAVRKELRGALLMLRSKEGDFQGIRASDLREGPVNADESRTGGRGGGGTWRGRIGSKSGSDNDSDSEEEPDEEWTMFGWGASQRPFPNWREVSLAKARIQTQEREQRKEQGTGFGASEPEIQQAGCDDNDNEGEAVFDSANFHQHHDNSKFREFVEASRHREENGGHASPPSPQDAHTTHPGDGHASVSGPAESSTPSLPSQSQTLQDASTHTDASVPRERTQCCNHRCVRVAGYASADLRPLLATTASPSIPVSATNTTAAPAAAATTALAANTGVPHRTVIENVTNYFQGGAHYHQPSIHCCRRRREAVQRDARGHTADDDHDSHDDDHSDDDDGQDVDDSLEPNSGLDRPKAALDHQCPPEDPFFSHGSPTRSTGTDTATGSNAPPLYGQPSSSSTLVSRSSTTHHAFSSALSSPCSLPAPTPSDNITNPPTASPWSEIITPNTGSSEFSSGEPQSPANPQFAPANIDLSDIDLEYWPIVFREQLRQRKMQGLDLEEDEENDANAIGGNREERQAWIRESHTKETALILEGQREQAREVRRTRIDLKTRLTNNDMPNHQQIAISVPVPVPVPGPAAVVPDDGIYPRIPAMRSSSRWLHGDPGGISRTWLYGRAHDYNYGQSRCRGRINRGGGLRKQQMLRTKFWNNAHVRESALAHVSGTQ